MLIVDVDALRVTVVWGVAMLMFDGELLLVDCCEFVTFLISVVRCYWYCLVDGVVLRDFSCSSVWHVYS